MKRSAAITVLLLLATSLSLLYAQQPGEPPKQPPQTAASEYRVMHLAELFEGDQEATPKIAELSVRVSTGKNQVQVNRTDMDSKDYERALNRWAREGWTLVTVNKSNYWVFVKARPGAGR